MAKKQDLFIVADEGFLGENSATSSSITRIQVSNKAGNIIKIWVEGNETEFIIKNGYGFDRHGAIEDFIRRNESHVIERVFNVR